jgi:hypothetical protein
MPAFAQSVDEDPQNRAANDDDINGGSGTRTKYAYVDNNPLTSVDPSGFDGAGLNECEKGVVASAGNGSDLIATNAAVQDAPLQCVQVNGYRGAPVFASDSVGFMFNSVGGVNWGLGGGSGGSGSGGNSSPSPPPPPPGKPPQTTQPKPPCDGSGRAARVADALDSASAWAGRVAVVSGVAAIVTSETGVGAAVFGAVAGIAEGTSYALAGVSAGINYFNGNSRGALATVLGTAVGAVLPRGLVMSVPGLKGSSRAVGDFVAGAEGDLAAQLTQVMTCHYQ